MNQRIQLMKTHVAALTLFSLLLMGGPANADEWIDRYWPLNSGDTKTFIYNGTDILTIDVFYDGGGLYEIYADSPDGSGSEFHYNDGTGIYLDHAQVGFINVYNDPPVLLMNDTMLQNGGSATTSTTVTQQGVDYPATYTVSITKAGAVTVPAGTFSDCRNITVTEKATVPGQGTITVKALTAVLAPDVGLIKKVVSLNPTVWAELVSGTVGGTDVEILATRAPVLSVKSPVAGQRIATNNNLVPVMGSFRGYAPGMEVYYQVNSGAWASAVVTGTNWSGTVTATPGTNIITALAVDIANRYSPDLNVNFQFVVSALLQVATVGKGAISPNYSNALLELGRSYTVTATPAAGFAFTDWTGRVNGDVVLTTNKAALSFLMQSNLSLTATFVDTNRPVVKITTPVANQRWSNSFFTVRGTATDNGTLAEVWYQLNSGEWAAATWTAGSTNWTADVVLSLPGTNSVSAFAVDAVGNHSVTNTTKFVYVLSGVLQVAIVGKGTVSPNYSNAVLEIGRGYTVTATPGTGYAFTNWTGRVGDDVVLSTNKAVLGFVMQSNLVLTATFADVAKPVLTVTAPTANQRWSNSLFAVVGKVTDNGPVAGVSYKLNGADWATAETANGWSNWTAGVTLTPGTNTLLAFATDAAGNRSATNTVRFVYVLTAPLNLAVIGKGKVNGATNGQPLEIGKSIVLTTTPGTGHVLTNWLVQVNGDTIRSTNKAVPFVMQSNLTLTATFADVVKPVLTITAPTANQRWSNSLFTVAGKVTDNGPVAGVSYKLNGADWATAETANGWSNWTAGVTLTPGTNTLLAFATDAAGNRSLTNTVKFIYVLTAPLELVVVGKGTVAGATNGQRLEIGKSIALTTTPGAGHVLTNWLVQVNGDTILSSNKAVPFVMQSNLVLTATFVDVTKPVLTITAPVAGQRWSNEVFTAAGKVTDNGPVAGVSYQLNGGDWSPAQSANGWSNWTATLNLAPGTNTLRAFATDAAGNRSATNSQSVIRVLTYWLPDYYYPTTEGNRWIYDGAASDGSPAQLEVRMDNTNYLITSFTGTTTVSNYTQNVIKVENAYGSYDSGSGVFSPYDDWSEYITLAGGWGIWGSDDSSESLRVDRGFIITNRLAVGQTVSLTRSAYTNGVYRGQITFKLQLLEVTNVTVPAGLFEQCLHVRITLSLGSSSQVHDDWLANSQGMIKQQGVSGDGAAEHWALISYQPVASRAKFNLPARPAFQAALLPAKSVAPTAMEIAVVAPVTPVASVTSVDSVVPVVPLQFEVGAGNLAVINGGLQLRLSGPSGAEVVLESSSDLLHWAPMQTNSLPAEGLFLSMPTSGQPAQFFRARLR